MSAKELTWFLGCAYMVLTAAIWQSEVFVTRGRKLHEVRWIYHLCFYGALIAAVRGYGWLALIVALPAMLWGGLLLNWTVGAIWSTWAATKAYRGQAGPSKRHSPHPFRRWH